MIKNKDKSTRVRRVLRHIEVTPDGEVMNEKSLSYLIEDDKEFYMTYCKVLGLFNDLGNADMKTLAWLVSNMPFNSNMQVITKGVKEKIAEEMGISVSGVNNALPKLLARKILYRDKDADKGRSAIYFINPEYYWKGDLKERNKMLKVIISQQTIEGNENIQLKGSEGKGDPTMA